MFHVAEASFRLYCTSDNAVLPSNSNRKMNYEMGPCLLGDPPKIDVVSPEADELEEENSLESLPSIKIYDEDVTVRFLLCGPPCTLVGVVDILTHFMMLGLFAKMLVFLYAIFTSKADSLFQDTFLLGSLADGLNALLRIEVSSLLVYSFNFTSLVGILKCVHGKINLIIFASLSLFLLK